MQTKSDRVYEIVCFQDRHSPSSSIPPQLSGIKKIALSNPASTNAKTPTKHPTKKKRVLKIRFPNNGW